MEDQRDAAQSHPDPASNAVDEHHLLLASPSNAAHQGVFSPEDIQDLLGGVLHEEDEQPAEKQPKLPALPALSSATSGSTAGSETAGTADCPQQGRSERKRSREKQRRSDMNQQFSALTSTLQQLEADEEGALRTPGVPFSSSIGSIGNNRVELMGRTIHVLNQLNSAYKRQKKLADDLQVQLAAAQKAGEETALKLKSAMESPQPVANHPNQVVMMVPMMMSTSSSTDTANAAPNGGMPMQMPSMVMPAMMQPQQAAAGATNAGATAPVSMPMMFMPAAFSQSAAPAASQQEPTSSSSSAASSSNNTKTPATSNTQTDTGGNLAHCA